MEKAKVFLKPGKERSIRRRHLWVFSGAIGRIDGAVQEGCVVDVLDSSGGHLATGHYQGGSIAVRVLAFAAVTPDVAFWTSRLVAAWSYRKRLGLVDNPHTNAYRLVCGEGDALPGLVIDYYNGTAVLQAHSVGMHAARHEIGEALRQVYGSRLAAVYDRSADSLSASASPGSGDGYLYGSRAADVVLENDCRFRVDWEAGQKTGFFIDQRENRSLLAVYAAGRRVLNAFCYSGGFSVYAAKAGAASVHSVDSSVRALELTEANLALNGFTGPSCVAFRADALRFLKETEQRYDLIVLDPPAYAKHLAARHRAVQAYKRLNAEAIRRLDRNGLLFTFCCSQVVDRPLFNATVLAAAIEAGRTVRIAHQLSQPPDHPVNPFHPESEYLKGLVLDVE